MIASDQIGVPIDKIIVIWGDTDTADGGGTMGSRSLQVGGSAVSRPRRARDKAQQIAASCWRPPRPTSCWTRTWGVQVAGRRRVEDLGRPRRGGKGPGRRPGDGTGFDAGQATFPFGAHVAVVEVDTETGL